MLGIILCGGQSSRMGFDKGLLILEARTWAQTAIDKLSTLNIPISISVNDKQKTEYAQVFDPSMLIVDNPLLSIKGPLQGVLSSHLQNPDEDLFLLACDLPLMESGILKELLNHYQHNRNYEAFIFIDENEPEPLCGIYTSVGLKKIIALLEENKLNRHSMKFVLGQLSVYEIALQPEQKICFRNFNAHAQLNGL